MKWGGKKTLLRRNWIVNALEKMTEYKLIIKADNTNNYKVKFENLTKKDFLELIQEKLKKESEKVEKPVITEKKEAKKKQLKLNNNYMKK